MKTSDFKVFITKQGNGAITYMKNGNFTKIFISKENKLIMEIFMKYYNELKSFKERHYAIAKWIVRDIRAEGYVFKAYANNIHNIRPIKPNEIIKETDVNLYRRKSAYYYYQDPTLEISDFERLLH